MQRTSTLVLTFILCSILAIPVFAEYNPDPNWNIAFIRDKSVWIMKADGSQSRMIFRAQNAVGRLSWSQDNERVAFARRGDVTVNYPDGGLGRHRCYDIYVAHIDSLQSGFFWFITDNLGSAYPQWSPDDNWFVYHYDEEANLANAIMPRYRVYYRNWNGSTVTALAPESAGDHEYLGVQPTISPDNKYVAYIHVQSQGASPTGSKNLGMVIVPFSGITRTDAELEQEAEKYQQAACPMFSPDGSEIAFLSGNQSERGIWLVAMDTREKRKIFTPPAGMDIRTNALSWSPDGQWLAFSSIDGNIYVVNRSGQELTQVSYGGNDYYPAFSKK